MDVQVFHFAISLKDYVKRHSPVMLILSSMPSVCHILTVFAFFASTFCFSMALFVQVQLPVVEISYTCLSHKNGIGLCYPTEIKFASNSIRSVYGITGSKPGNGLDVSVVN